MNVANLVERSAGLFERMRDDGHSESYVTRVMTEARWLEANGGRFETYAEALEAREAETASESYRHGMRAAFGAVYRYLELGEYPDRRTSAFRPRTRTYDLLLPGFRAVIDAYRADPHTSTLRASTADGAAGCCSSMLLALQEMGRTRLAEVTERDVVAFFTDDETGGPAFSHSYRKSVASVLRSDLGDLTADARRLLGMLPRPVRRLKNVRYLDDRELDAVRLALRSADSALCPRDRAIGELLLATGMRASDVASLRLDSVRWDLDEIRLVQRKTGAPLTLPLLPRVGNAIYDYLAFQRPGVEDDHLFLSADGRDSPMTAGSVSTACARIYREAGIRQSPGDRRGSHLFRHHVATSMVGSGVARPVASSVLGHESPDSIDAYLHADMVDLRGCSIDPSPFPVAKGVFGS